MRNIIIFYIKNGEHEAIRNLYSATMDRLMENVNAEANDLVGFDIMSIVIVISFVINIVSLKSGLITIKYDNLIRCRPYKDLLMQIRKIFTHGQMNLK